MTKKLRRLSLQVCALSALTIIIVLVVRHSKPEDVESECLVEMAVLKSALQDAKDELENVSVRYNATERRLAKVQEEVAALRAQPGDKELPYQWVRSNGGPPQFDLDAVVDEVDTAALNTVRPDNCSVVDASDSLTQNLLEAEARGLLSMYDHVVLLRNPKAASTSLQRFLLACAIAMGKTATQISILRGLRLPETFFLHAPEGPLTHKCTVDDYLKALPGRRILFITNHRDNIIRSFSLHRYLATALIPSILRTLAEDTELISTLSQEVTVLLHGDKNALMRDDMLVLDMGFPQLMFDILNRLFGTSVDARDDNQTPSKRVLETVPLKLLAPVERLAYAQENAEWIGMVKKKAWGTLQVLLCEWDLWPSVRMPESRP